MAVLMIGETALEYSLKRSATAKKASITVTPDTIVVTVPAGATDEQINAVLHRRRAWLIEQRRMMAAKQSAQPTIHRLVSGAKVPYRGRMAKLTVTPHAGTSVEVSYRNGFNILLPDNLALESADSVIESSLRLWLKKRVREDVRAFVARHGEANGLKAKSVNVKDQFHMWGSCGQDRSVNLNWRLVFAPKPVLEYAVVHELCHLKHRNHGPEFWSLVASILPDWSLRKVWLDKNEHLLGWRKVEASP